MPTKRTAAAVRPPAKVAKPAAPEAPAPTAQARPHPGSPETPEPGEVTWTNFGWEDAASYDPHMGNL